MADSQQAASLVADTPGPGRFPYWMPTTWRNSRHELKTPLTAIAAAAEIMRDERLGEMKNERYLNYAARYS